VTRTARTFVRRTVMTCAVILAVAVVTTVSADLGPALRSLAEEQGSRYLERPLHIGAMQVRLWDGSYVFEDLVIEGLKPDSVPFFTAKRIRVSMTWGTLLSRRLVFDAIELTDWQMHVEMNRDGTQNFPKLTPRGPRGQSAWTTTLQYVRAGRGQFTFQDHNTPWGIVARNLDITVARPGSEYVGQAKFSDGLTTIQQYVPFRTDMTSTFTIDSGRVIFDRISLKTEGTESVLNGDVNLSHFPELMFQVKSTIDLPKMRELFFAGDTFTLSGTSQFLGTFHLFKEPRADGTTRTGRELKGTYVVPTAGVNDYRFDDLRGQVRWTPEVLRINEATTKTYGGDARFTYVMAPLSVPGVTPKATFAAAWNDVDLTEFTNAREMEGIRLAGRLSGNNLLEWPLRRFSARTGKGELHITPPDGVTLMTREMPLERIREVEKRGQPAGPFSPLTPFEPVPVGGDIAYAFGPEQVNLSASRLATESTLVEFQGQTAYGGESHIPFHVSSADWQESDRVFAGLLTAFGVRSRAIPIGGYGTFDGVMSETFRRPRIEGDFSGAQMRAWDVVWGSVTGAAIIQNSYVDVSDVVITSGESRIRTTGRFSIGYPRSDGGEELNARVEIAGRPVADLRHAFTLDEYDLDGILSGEFDIKGRYLAPDGFGKIEITDGVAYGEPFESATAGVRLEGDGARLENIQATKGGGRGTGAAFVSWNGTYSFNFDARSIPVESLAAAKNSPRPIAGLVDFTAGGSGTFDSPRYDVRGTVRDLFVADEGIGQIVSNLSIDNKLMTVRLEAASPRLAVSGSGRIALTPELDAELSITVSDTSLDPYVRAFQPQLSPYTTAVASGSIRIVGELANVEHLLVDATVDRLDVRLFDYALRNARPIRIALDRQTVRVTDMRIVGQDTQLDVSGVVSLRDSRIAIRATGDANLAVLQGFAADVRSSGMAALSAMLEGPLEDPVVSGTLDITDGRLRHFALPHALEDIGGSLQFDSRGVTLDGLTGRLARGDVTFGGRIDKQGYLPGRLDVTMAGKGMRLRLFEGMQSLVDAELSLQGSMESATLSGRVTVNDAVYLRPFGSTGGLLDLATEDATPPVTPAEPTIPLRYDIRIVAPQTLQVRNSSVRLTASADLQLQGTFDRPLLFGRAEAARGEFLFEGRRYLLTRGSVDFNNPTKIEPFFDLETETRIRVPGETYRVTVRATGPWVPALEFSADPPLPEPELLALLLSDVAPGQDVEFRQYQDVTPQEQLVRERAARALTSPVSSEVGRVVEQTFGVDTFQITPSIIDPNTQSSRLDLGARVTVGKRLSDRVYLTYSRSLSSSTRDQIILLEYDQTDRYSWVLSRNEDKTYAIELRVRRTF
jgi:TamB, inner membrane protein subunit of TAM complex